MARRRVKTVSGQPGVGLLQRGTNRYRSIRTLIKRDPAKGITQPEARQALLTSTAVVEGGVRVTGGGKSARGRIISKAKVTSPLAGQTKVRKGGTGPIKRRNSGV